MFGMLEHKKKITILVIFALFAIVILASSLSNPNIGNALRVFTIPQGGTGTSTLPAQGELLMGNAFNGYDLVPTSSLGFDDFWNLVGSQLTPSSSIWGIDIDGESNFVTSTFEKPVTFLKNGVASGSNFGVSSHGIQLNAERWIIASSTGANTTARIVNAQPIGDTEGVGNMALYLGDGITETLRFVISVDGLAFVGDSTGGGSYTYGASLAPTGDGVDVNFAGGSTVGGSGNGGNMRIYPGLQNGSGTIGKIYLGNGQAGEDYMTVWDGETNDWIITLMEDEDYMKFSDDINLDKLDASKVLMTDASKTVTTTDITVDIPVSFSMYDAEPARGSETSLDGAFLSLATGQPINSSTPLIVTKGIGKMVVVINAGSDIAGDITVTGTSVDRDTGVTTTLDTDILTVDALTTDNSDTDSNGNIRHSFTGAYITSKWFVGTVTLSTTDLNLSDVDVYHVSFEQFDDQSDIVLDTFDVNLLTTNVAAEFDAYLYALMVTGDKANISREASLNVGADGEIAIADKYWRLRRGNIAKALDGTTDGVWADIHYANSPAYVEDVTLKTWATKTQTVTLN